MEQLFTAFDNTLDMNVTLGVKYGLLLNGSNLTNRDKHLANLEEYQRDILKDMTGIMEIDGHSSEKEGQGNMNGAVEILAHIGDVFGRRYAAVGD